MPTKFDLGCDIPAGHIIAELPDNQLEFNCIEFTSTEDGQKFADRLNGTPNYPSIPSYILSKMSSPVHISQVEQMLAIIENNGKATIYVNEHVFSVLARVSNLDGLEVGSTIHKDDIIDIKHLKFDVSIPNDAGILFIFSVGGRKGLFYDFRYGSISYQYDIESFLGQAFSYVAFQERFNISDNEWATLLAAKWFPFAGLGGNRIDTLINDIRTGVDPDQRIDEIVTYVKNRAEQLLDDWRNHSSFIDHITILERAFKGFQEDDFICCTVLLFTRIEGILRTHFNSLGSTSKISQKIMSQSAIEAELENKQSLLLPQRFETYLLDVYFENFDPNKQNIGISRNSVGHGVASESEFNQKSALIGILIVQQLFYFLPKSSNLTEMQ